MNKSTTRIADLKHHEGSTVTVHAWITHLRSKGKLGFAVVRDGTGVMQAVVVKAEVSEQAWE
uniref:OB-fold nucleic acid binding domain-containing protein n=1 Tax=Gemmatimonas sp. TaxID=1962908 RepID=UPI0027B8B706